MGKILCTVSDIRQLPIAYQRRIPPAFLDENGHVNVQYYLQLMEQGVKHFYQQAGLGDIYARADVYGNFALEQHIRYFAEILQGETVTVHMRLLELKPKRSYIMGFLVNSSQEKLAAVVELVALNVAMAQRRAAPYPAEAYAALQAFLREHSRLAWPAPTCGVMGL